MRQTTTRYRKRNREKSLAAARAWKRKKEAQEPGYLKASRRAYYVANIEKERARSRAYQQKKTLLQKAVHDPNAWLKVNGINMVDCPRMHCRMLATNCGKREECFLGGGCALLPEDATKTRYNTWRHAVEEVA
ncbi:hypothetical protein [Bilophila wadsworthia]|uniref:hypothetical protein n=1 Tax=Bilophila wadsworthia TaxID=35833 RepID=UPI00266517A8|nr:hypothetical protein [Bilophila wadsworthia]